MTESQPTNNLQPQTTDQQRSESQPTNNSQSQTTDQRRSESQLTTSNGGVAHTSQLSGLGRSVWQQDEFG